MKKNSKTNSRKPNKSGKKPPPLKGEAPGSQVINSLNILLNEHRYAEAEATAREMTLSFPSCGIGWKALGVVFKQMGRNAEAMVAMEKAIKLSPMDAEAHNNLGAVYMELGQFDEAEASSRRALKIKPDKADAHFNLGNTLKKLGRLSGAETSYLQALKFQPDFAEAHYNLGITLKELGRLNEAEASYRQALRHNQNYAGAYCNLGNTLNELGRLSEAETGYRQALVIRPDFVEAYYNLGHVLKELGRRNEAQACYQKALKLNPGLADAHCNMGQFLQDAGHLEEAEACYRLALKLNPNFAEALCNLGHILFDFGRLDEAEASCRRALRIRPDFAEANNNLGSALHGMGRINEAVACYRKALEIKPDCAWIYFNLHSLLLNHDDMSLAFGCLEKSLKLEPSNANYDFFLGMMHEYIGNPEAAADHFARVESSDNLSRARLDAWWYLISVNKKFPLMTGCNIEAFKIGLDYAAIDGLILEFGVRFGTSIRLISALVDQQVHGFDSFEGLPEHWHNELKGSYSTHGSIPDVPDNVALYPGWFSDTLPQFLKNHSGPVRFMNIDCDIYSSTRTVLDLLADRVTPGTVIVFDEYIGNERWRDDEFKAFQEAVAHHGWNYEYISFSFYTKQVAVRIV